MIAFMGLKFMYVSTVNKILNSCNSYDYVKYTNDFTHVFLTNCVDQSNFNGRDKVYMKNELDRIKGYLDLKIYSYYNCVC